MNDADDREVAGFYALAGMVGCHEELCKAQRAVDVGDWETVATILDEAARWLTAASAEMHKRLT